MSEHAAPERPDAARKTGRYGKQPISPLELVTGFLGLILMLGYISRTLEEPIRFFTLVTVIVLASLILTENTSFSLNSAPADQEPAIGANCPLLATAGEGCAEVKPGDFCPYPRPHGW